MGREKPCSVCTRPGGREAVDALLEQKTPMAEIAKLTGFSKSSIGRHAQKHFARAKAEEVKTGRYDSCQNVMWTRRLDGTFFRWPTPRRFHGTLGDRPGPGDVVLTLQFEQPAIIKNPKALVSDQHPSAPIDTDRI